jgi:hypothetical protein
MYPYAVNRVPTEDKIRTTEGQQRGISETKRLLQKSPSISLFPIKN